MLRAVSEGFTPLRRLCMGMSHSACPSSALVAAACGQTAAKCSLHTRSDALISLRAFQPTNGIPGTTSSQQPATPFGSPFEAPSDSATQPARGFAAQAAPAKRPVPGRGLMPAAPSPLRRGIVHVQGSRNNTILTLTDEDGNTQAWASAGCLGFKNARKCTSYAAEAAAEKLAGDAVRLGFKSVQLRIKGLGQGKIASVKMLTASGLTVTKITECTPLPHNGCRPPKKRRV